MNRFLKLFVVSKTFLIAALFLGLFFTTFFQSNASYAACPLSAGGNADVGEIVFETGFQHCFKGCTDNGWDVFTTCKPAFVSAWNTTNISAGSSANNQVKLPLVNGGTYNFEVDWGDGNKNVITAWNQAATTHTYSSSGSYTITIRGTIRGFRFANTGDRLKITNISKWGPLNLGNFGAYFQNAENLTVTATDILDTTGTTNMTSLFYGATSLTNVPNMGSWNMSAVTNMTSMFLGATNFNQDISGWNTASVTLMPQMFMSAISFNQPIGSWNTSNVTNMSDMFHQASAFNQALNSWNVGNVLNMSQMFRYASSFNQPVGAWNTAKVTNMSNMFQNAAVFNQPIGTWNVALVTNMSNMFGDADAFNYPLGSWNTGNVTDMSYMFFGTAVFNQALNTWNVGNVTTMQGMFQTAVAFNQPLNSWNTIKVTDMSSMFRGATVFNGLLGGWNTVAVTTMASMFQGAPAFNQNIAGWNTANVINMQQMFQTAAVFNQNISVWNTGNVTNMSAMFYQANAFNQPIGTWNTAKVTNMQAMFYSAIAFSQDIGAWNVSLVTNMQSMFLASAFSEADYNKLLCGWTSLPSLQSGVQFHAGSAKYGLASIRSILTSAPNNWTVTDGGAGVVVTSCPDAFVSAWNTNNTSAGSSANNQVTLPLNSGGTYNFTVDWGDGTSNTITSWNQAQKTHTYSSGGTYTIKIRGTIVGWQFNNSGDRLKLTNISQWGKLRLGNNTNYFLGATNLTITASDVLDTTGTTTMSGTFMNCTSLTTVPNMGSWNMSAVTDISSMFQGATNFNQNISGWNTGNVTNMNSVFNLASSFNQPIGTWDTSKVTITSSMFRQATAFNQNIGGWNTSSLTNMGSMFYQASAFSQSLNWNVSGITDMSYVFYQATAFNGTFGLQWNNNFGNVTNTSFMFYQAAAFNTNIATWDVSKVTNMRDMFNGATNFNQNISVWNTGLVTNMTNMFRSATNFNQNISTWNVGNVTGMFGMFMSATNFNQNLGAWNVANVTDMGFMFSGSALNTTNYNGLICGWSLLPSLKPNVAFHAGSAIHSIGGVLMMKDILTTAPNSWVITDGGNTGAAGNCSDMFVSNWNTNNTSAGSSANNQIKLPTYNGGSYNFTVYWGDGSKNTITAWNQAEVTHTYASAGSYTIRIRGTFQGFRFGNTGDRLKMTGLSQWGAMRLGNNNGYFYGAANLSITATDVLDMTGTTTMQAAFMGCTALTAVPSMNSWNMSAVTNMAETFRDATGFNQNISGWNTANVTTMQSMFFGASAFNQSISLWSTGNVTTMDSMFRGASAFNQNISGWNTANVTSFNGMFFGASVFNQPVSSWNTANVTTMNSMFLNAATFNQTVHSWNIGKVTNMFNMFTGSSFSKANYNALLCYWPGQTLKPNVQLSVPVQYSVVDGHDALTGPPNNWTVFDSGSDGSGQFCF